MASKFKQLFDKAAEKVSSKFKPDMKGHVGKIVAGLVKSIKATGISLDRKDNILTIKTNANDEYRVFIFTDPKTNDDVALVTIRDEGLNDVFSQVVVPSFDVKKDTEKVKEVLEKFLTTI